MNTKDLTRLSVRLGEATRRATEFISKFILAGGDKSRLEQEVRSGAYQPQHYEQLMKEMAA